MSDEVFIFANPIAGRGKGKAVTARIVRALEQQGYRARHFQKAASELADEELHSEKPPLAMVTIGGDGTLRGAVERMLTFCGGVASKVPSVVVVPLGTANLMARHLSLRWNLRNVGPEVVACIAARRLAHLDVAMANDRIFLLMAGVGMDAAIVHELDRVRSGPIDYTSYALPAVLALQKYDYPALRVHVDGKLVFDSLPGMAFVGNAAEYGLGFPILTHAVSTDGLLDVCVLPCRSRQEVIMHLMAVATGDHIHQEGVVYLKCKSVRIESAQQVPVQIDGEASGHTPLKIDLLPERLRFIVRESVGSGQ